MVEMAAGYEEDGLEAAEAFAESVGVITSVIGDAVDALVALQGYTSNNIDRALASFRRDLPLVVDAMVEMEAPHHRLVSLIGNIAPDGSASFFDVVMRIADKVRAPHYPMLVPVISPTAEENAAFHALPSFVLKVMSAGLTT
jgi:hypothetical protein